MKQRTIVQKVSLNAMQTLFLCVLIVGLGLGLARAADDEAKPVSSAYVSIGKPMVLNLSGARRLTFLQIGADILVADSDEDEIKLHVPAIRHSLIMLLSEQPATDMKSPVKREEIRQQATARIKGLISDLHGSDVVSDVLFSSVLVQ